MSESFLLNTGTRYCHDQNQFKSDWDRLVVSALQVAEQVDPYQMDLPEGTVLRAVDALGHQNGQRK